MSNISELHMAIMNKDSLSFNEVDPIVNEMKDRVKAGENPETVLEEEGWEPDYFFDILP